MIAIDPRALSGLEWKQPAAFSRSFELHSGESVLATLKFIKTLGSLAEAEVQGKGWTFKRNGFLSPKVSARLAGSEQDIALYEPNWSGTKGIFRMAGGEILDFRAANFWGSEWVLSDSRGQELLRYHTKGLMHAGAEVDASPQLRERSDLALLLLVTWYVLVLHREDAASTTVMTGG